ncbi:MAG TPA: DUF3108 domain-containing protein [Bacteroidia bacterium]|jgi:hypothetical protein
MWKRISLLLLYALVAQGIFAQAKNTLKNEAFLPGERISYKILYNWGLIWVDAGEVTFGVDQVDYKGTPSYYFTGAGSTFPKYDWIYKVRDKFESWADTGSLRPYRFVRDQKEGQTIIYESAYFNFQRKKVYDVLRISGKPAIDSVKITANTIDVMTAIYYSRCIDFSKYKVNDTIPITLYLENKIYPVYIRYVGKEDYTLEGMGTYHCIKFKPLLIEGTIFKGGENMTVWVTDDKNKIPVHVETPIVVGTVKVYLTKVTGNRNPFTSKFK